MGGEMFETMPMTPTETNNPFATTIEFHEPFSCYEPAVGLLRPGAQQSKRVLDILFALLLAAVALPFAVVIAIAIRLETRGPIFFRHERIGKHGRRFGLWKFRYMVVNADALLDEYLDRHPERRLEWDAKQKLKDDPRATRVGRLLRRTSLDELPQIWNILRGDMSMVGPRPIVADEIGKYGSAYELYSQVAPGLTGVWQVSGRNSTSYAERTQIDSDYIRGWTLGGDLQILLRTIPVVLGHRNAY